MTNKEKMDKGFKCLRLEAPELVCVDLKKLADAAINEAYEKAAQVAESIDATNAINQTIRSTVESAGNWIAKEIRKLKDQANDE
jgi:hypothetical protein